MQNITGGRAKPKIRRGKKARLIKPKVVVPRSQRRRQAIAVTDSNAPRPFKKKKILREIIIPTIKKKTTPRPTIILPTIKKKTTAPLPKKPTHRQNDVVQYREHVKNKIRAQCEFVNAHLSRQEMLNALATIIPPKQMAEYENYSDSKICQLLTVQKQVILDQLPQVIANFCSEEGQSVVSRNFMCVLIRVLGSGLTMEQLQRISSKKLCTIAQGWLERHQANLPAKGWLRSIWDWVKDAVGYALDLFLPHYPNMTKIAMSLGSLYFMNSLTTNWLISKEIALKEKQLAFEAAKLAMEDEKEKRGDWRYQMFYNFPAQFNTSFQIVVGTLVKGSNSFFSGVADAGADLVYGLGGAIAHTTEGIGGAITSSLASVGMTLSLTAVGIGVGVVLVAIAAGYLVNKVNSLMETPAQQTIWKGMNVAHGILTPAKDYMPPQPTAFPAVMSDSQTKQMKRRSRVLIEEVN
jgi:hypothetical protein